MRCNDKETIERLTRRVALLERWLGMRGLRGKHRAPHHFSHKHLQLRWRLQDGK